MCQSLRQTSRRRCHHCVAGVWFFVALVTCCGHENCRQQSQKRVRLLRAVCFGNRCGLHRWHLSFACLGTVALPLATLQLCRRSCTSQDACPPCVSNSRPLRRAVLLAPVLLPHATCRLSLAKCLACCVAVLLAAFWACLFPKCDRAMMLACFAACV